MGHPARFRSAMQHRSTALAVAALIAAAASLPGAAAGKLRTAPDVASKVAAEKQEDIHIHDGFASQETEDKKVVAAVKANKALSAIDIGGPWVVALDRDLKTKMLVQVTAKAARPVGKALPIKDPCSGIPCAASL